MACLEIKHKLIPSSAERLIPALMMKCSKELQANGLRATVRILIVIFLSGPSFPILAQRSFAASPTTRIVRFCDPPPTPPDRIEPKGPDEIPDHLPGLWKVSLYVKEGYLRGHAWIRYENLANGEAHTVARFLKGIDDVRHPITGLELVPSIEITGLHWDYDLRFEHEIQGSKYCIDSVVIRDPKIFRGSGIYGHGVVRNNCITYGRDAWCYYTGRQYELAAIHLPNRLLREARKSVSETPSNPEGRYSLQYISALRRDISAACVQRLPPCNSSVWPATPN